MTRPPPLPRTAAFPHDDPEPAFGAPWQAQAFALTLALHERGVFSWSEWTAALGARIGAAPTSAAPLTAGAAAETYYRHWLETLEALVATKGAGSALEIERWRLAWQRAAARTPHGQPIEVSRSDFEPTAADP